MKSIKEIITMLVKELVDHFDEIESANNTLVYYNEILGDTSFLLAGLLESLLKKNFTDWNHKKWIDDSLITDIVMENDKLVICGVMIWGMEDTTEQWTDPFSFEIKSLKFETSFMKFIFRFGDFDNDEISYEKFRNNREYWNVANRNWKYVISSNDI